MTRRAFAPLRPAHGFSLIELLVAMAIGLILTLAITSVLIRTEGSKRSTTAVNDINQSGAYTTYVLDRAIRSAGSGFAQSWRTVFGCLLDVSKNSTAALPLAASMPATSAFANFGLPVRLAPFVIGKDLANVGTDVRGDVLMVMAGTAGVGESPQSVTPGSVDLTTDPTKPTLQLQTTLGYVTDDMLLLADPVVTGGCLMQQVGSGHLATDAGPVLPLGGTYYRATGTNVNLASFGTSTTALQLGRDVANPPLFRLFGVGANNTLFSYDLLQPSTATPPPEAAVSDGIVEMRAVYGLDTTSPPDGKLDTWVDATDAFAASILTNGSTTSATSLRQIVAVRIGLILRTPLQERSPSSSGSGVLSPETFAQASGTTLTLFGDLPGLQKTRTLTPAELGYRFRTVEVTIPLRNVLLAP